MVEWKKLGEVCAFNRGKTITAKDAVDGDIPVIAGGQTPSYYHNEFNREGESITVAGSGAYAGFVSYWNQPIFVSDAFTIDPLKGLKHKYLFHWAKMNQEKIIATQKGAGVPHVHGKDIANFLIPIPSLSEQQRIVSILDTFTSSISNLKQQIEERRKQYEYERDLLLDLEGKEGVEMKKLGDFAEIGTGSSNTQDELESGRYPFFVRSQIVKWKDDYEFDEIAIITSGDGVGVGKVLHYYEGKYALHQRAYRIHVENDSIVPKFVFYFMQKDFYWYIMSNAYAASVTSVRRPMLINYPIPIPPLSTQSRIVSILDTFEQSISNLEEQLAMREKQYEYYRNQLLTFEGEEERGKT